MGTLFAYKNLIMLLFNLKFVIPCKKHLKLRNKML